MARGESEPQKAQIGIDDPTRVWPWSLLEEVEPLSTLEMQSPTTISQPLLLPFHFRRFIRWFATSYILKSVSRTILT